MNKYNFYTLRQKSYIQIEETEYCITTESVVIFDYDSD